MQLDTTEVELTSIRAQNAAKDSITSFERMRTNVNFFTLFEKN